MPNDHRAFSSESDGATLHLPSHPLVKNDFALPTTNRAHRITNSEFSVCLCPCVIQTQPWRNLALGISHSVAGCFTHMPVYQRLGLHISHRGGTVPHREAHSCDGGVWGEGGGCSDTVLSYWQRAKVTRHFAPASEHSSPLSGFHLN